MAIQKEVEEATALELPMLQKNLVFLSTIASVGYPVRPVRNGIGYDPFILLHLVMKVVVTLLRELSIGISEALYNTALGIGTSAIAIIMYNMFTTKIDSITYGIDESGFTLTQSFASLYK